MVGAPGEAGDAAGGGCCPRGIVGAPGAEGAAGVAGAGGWPRGIVGAPGADGAAGPGFKGTVFAPVGAAGGLGAAGAVGGAGAPGVVGVGGTLTGTVSSSVGTGAVAFFASGIGAVAFFGSGTTPVDFLGCVIPVPGLARSVILTVSFFRGTVEVLALGFAGGCGWVSSSLIWLLY